MEVWNDRAAKLLLVRNRKDYALTMRAVSVGLEFPVNHCKAASSSEI